MSTFIRSAIAALAIFGAVSAASAAPRDDQSGSQNYNADSIFEQINERAAG
jgi:hypothetical protein